VSSIIVCSLADLHKVSAREDPAAIVTLINAHTPVERPVNVEADRHLTLHFNDIPAEMPGLTAPGIEHLERFLGFASAWDQLAPLLIHCFAGISRSTAGAYIAMLALEPERDEFDLAAELRSASPSATPNPRLIALADAKLGRGGRMIAAIESIGRGADAFQGDPFRLPLKRGASVT
jgi:predicted protein tyrosine phosphatase